MVYTRRQSQLRQASQKSATQAVDQSTQTSTDTDTMEVDPRLFSRPTTSKCVTGEGGSSSKEPKSPTGMETIDNESFQTPRGRSHIETSASGGIDDKLDKMMTMITSLQTSVRDLHVEFNAIKPRVAQVTTNQASAGFLGKRHDDMKLTQQYLVNMAKKRKNRQLAQQQQANE